MQKRLTSLLPDGLDVCYVVNSASEANELALRLSRAYTKQKDMIVLEAAYHGNTTSLIDISPYKHDGPGGIWCARLGAHCSDPGCVSRRI